MYIAMNRFQVKKGREKDLEKIWKKRETRLDEVDGFKEFHLIMGETEETYTLFVSHSTWKSKEDFINWTRSDAFRKAHEGVGEQRDVYLGHPIFEGFEVII